ncbi:hypothetical protein FOZ63_004393, partial [Perkinsus olseni]
RLGEASPNRRAVQRSATDSQIRLSWVSPVYQEAQSLEDTPNESEVEEAGLLDEGECGAAVVLAGDQSVAKAPSSDLDSTTAPMAAPGLNQDSENVLKEPVVDAHEERERSEREALEVWLEALDEVLERYQATIQNDLPPQERDRCDLPPVFVAEECSRAPEDETPRGAALAAFTSSSCSSLGTPLSSVCSDISSDTSGSCDGGTSQEGASDDEVAQHENPQISPLGADLTGLEDNHHGSTGSTKVPFGHSLPNRPRLASAAPQCPPRPALPPRTRLDLLAHPAYGRSSLYATYSGGLSAGERG